MSLRVAEIWITRRLLSDRVPARMYPATSFLLLSPSREWKGSVRRVIVSVERERVGERRFHVEGA